MRLVITYDISDDANRRRIYRTLQRYGAWRQYSVFEVDVSKTQRVELEDELKAHVDESENDRIRLYRLCGSCQGDVSDIGSEPPEEQSNIV